MQQKRLNKKSSMILHKISRKRKMKVVVKKIWRKKGRNREERRKRHSVEKNHRPFYKRGINLNELIRAII
jgi:hypothetical protein